MPAGEPFGTYFKGLIAAALSMAAGSSVINRIFQPLSDLDEYIEREMQSRIEANKQTNRK